MPGMKIRTWLHTLPSDLPMNTSASAGNDTIQPLDADADEKESSFTLSGCVDKTHQNKTDESHTRTRRVRQRSADYTAHIDDTSQVDKEAETRQPGKVGKIDSAVSGLKYNASHARVRAKFANKRKRNATKSDEQEEIPGDNSQRSSSSTTANRRSLRSDTLDRSIALNRMSTSAGSDRQYSAETDWSRVIELGKEMRPKRRKLKKLDVSIEKKKNPPRIIENVALTPRNRINLIEDAACHTNGKETSVSNLLEESNSREQADKDLSGAKLSPETSGEMKSREFNTSLSNRSAMEASSYITLEEGRQVRIINLNNDQVSNIIGFDRVEETSPRTENQRGENATVAKCRNDSPHRLTVLTPEKLNQSVDEDKISRSVTRTPAGKLESSLPAGDRTPGSRMNSSAQKTSEKISSPEFQSPIHGRLSLRRKVIIGDHKSTDLSPLKQLSSNKSPINRHVEDTSDSSPVAEDDARLSSRLTTARRDLTSQIFSDQVPIRRVSSKKAVEIKDNANVSVKFMKLGTLTKRRNVKYFYLGSTKREQSFPAKVGVTPVCTCNNWNYNMQQSVNRSESEQHQVTIESHSVTRSSNNSQHDITVIENVRSVQSALKDAEQSSIHKVSNVSTPRKNIDSHSNQKKITDPARSIERSSNLTNQSNESVQETCQMSSQIYHKKPCVDNNTTRIDQKISHTFPGTTNSIKLLSPDKDSQLKYLAIDSPMSERRRPMGSTRRQFEHDKSATKENNFSEAKSLRSATPGTQEPTSESSEFTFQFRSDKKRKRIKRISDEEEFTDEATDKIDISISSDDDDQRTIKLDEYKKLSAKLDGKKRRLSSPHDQNDQVIVLDSNKQDKRVRKYKRIIPTSSGTESESPTHNVRNQKRHKTDDRHDQQNVSIANAPKEKCSVAQDMDEDLRIQSIVSRWSNEHNASQKRLIMESSIQRCSPEEKSTSRQASRLANSPGEAEKHNGANQTNSAITESDMFESNSIFGVENLDCIMQTIRPNRSQTSQKLADRSNEDIINKVLEIDRSAPRSGGTAASQREKNSREHLLHDNFDEIIANVELPQSDDVMSQAKQPSRNLQRTLTQQRMSKCLAVTNEPCNTAQESPITISSTSDDMFEHCDGSSRKSRVTLSQNIVPRQLDKENIASRDEKRPRDYTRRNRKDVEAKIDLDTNTDDSRRIATSKHSASREKETSFDRVDANEYLEIDKECSVSARSADRLLIDDSKTRRATAASDESKNNSFEDDTLMNVTQHQAQLQIFEEDLFGIPATRAKATKLASQDDSSREKQGTPGKRKQTAQDKKAFGEYSAEEDDVVENTPERKMKNSGNNVTAIKSRKNIATLYSSPISNQPADRTPSTSNIFHKKDPPKSNASTPMNRLKTLPLYQSTPKVVHAAATAIKHPDAFTKSKKTEPTASGSVLSARQVESKVPENACRQADRQKLCFVCSGLTPAQIRHVTKFAKRRNANYVNHFDPSVTHVIVSTVGKENVTKSTLKYLQGIAYRKWIVSYRWIEDCDKERKLLDEVPYEATMDNDGVNETASRNSRLRQKGLFEDFTFLCVGPYINVTLHQYQDLLLATGATVVDSLEGLAKARGLRGIVIQDNTHDDKTIKHWSRATKAAPIIVDWVVECISRYKLFELAPYIQCFSLQDICAIGYSRELMGEEEYSDDET
ncbi:Breast cancer type 1 susceptibility protein-like protein [Ooceraea biroi]|nr:Breast cancer type 1 susceptibility protein-like protein [Ooceraea biroi]